MNILSLFDGMSCGMIAFRELGISIENYFAYEIDKYAIKTSLHNFPNIKQCGDVFKADFTQYNNIDFLIGGSPCTYWSIARTANRETEASGLGWELFSQYVRALHEAKPKYFIYENNESMSQQIRASITETFGFEPVLINSSLVSAQNRKRLYWVARKNSKGGYSKVNVEQLTDRGILLKDVINGTTDRDKARTIMSSAGRTTTREYFAHSQGNMKFFPINTTVDSKARTLKAQYSKNNEINFCCSKFMATGVARPVRVGCMPSPNGEIKNSQGMRIYSINAKSVNLTALGGGMGGRTGLYAIPCNDYRIDFFAEIVEYNECGEPTNAISGYDFKTYAVYKIENERITIKGKQYPIRLADGYYIIRKLSVSECMKLQTVPEWYDFSCVSNNQAYKMLGNGWTVEVIKHLISCILEKTNSNVQIEFDDILQ